MKSKKSKKIMSCAIAAALVMSAAMASFSAFAASDYSQIPGYSDNGTTDNADDDYVQRTLKFNNCDLADVKSEQLPCEDAMLEDGYAVNIQIPTDYVPADSVVEDFYGDNAENYEFAGWYCNSNDTIYQPGDSVPVTSNSFYLYPRFNYVGPRTVVVDYYDGFNWTTVETSTITDSSIKSYKTKAPAALTNSSNTFLGWVVYDDDGNEVELQPGEEFEMKLSDSDCTYISFYAVWESKTFAFNDKCTIYIQQVTDKYDNDAYQSEWGVYLKYIGQDVQNVSGQVTTGDRNYTVYDSGAELKAPSASLAPSRDGYVFSGWGVDPYGDEGVYQPGEEMPYDGAYYSLYALYIKETKDTNTIKTACFDGLSWTIVKTDEIAQDATSYEVEVPAAITNDENTFKGWRDVTDGTVYQPGDKITVTDASRLTDGTVFEFYAVWEKSTLAVEETVNMILVQPTDAASTSFDEFKTVQVKVNAVYNSDTGEYTLPTAQSITVPSDVPKMEGMTFKGWNTKSDGSGKTYKSGDKVPVTVNEYGYIDNIILYAVFGSSSGNGGTTTGNPGTGDDFNAVPYVAAAAVSLGTMACVIAYKKKRQEAEDAQ